ncbi:hypothetical protein [Thermocrinis sp.]
MSAKAKIIVLRKILVGEWDLLAYAYGTFGRGRILVRKGFYPKNAYSAVFEPFNLLTLDYHQSGELLILNDVIDVEFYSYLALKDYRRFLWMSKVAHIIASWISYYDSNVFDLLQNYLRMDIKNYKVFEIKLKLELVRALGIYREDLFEGEMAKVVNEIDRECRVERLEKIFLSKPAFMEISEALEKMLKRSLD